MLQLHLCDCMYVICTYVYIALIFYSLEFISLTDHKHNISIYKFGIYLCRSELLFNVITDLLVVMAISWRDNIANDMNTDCCVYIRVHHNYLQASVEFLCCQL